MCLLFVSRQDTNAFVREAIGNFVQENVPLLQELSLERRVILKTLIIRREYINHQEKKIFEFPIGVRISSYAGRFIREHSAVRRQSLVVIF